MINKKESKGQMYLVRRQTVSGIFFSPETLLENAAALGILHSTVVAHRRAALITWGSWRRLQPPV